MTRGLDDLIGVGQFSERHQRHIAAPPEAVWAALHDVGWRDLPLTRALMAIRAIPERLIGGTRPAPGRNLLRDAPVPVLAAESPHTIVAAGVMQPWKLRGGPRPPRLDARALQAFDAPGWVKCGVDFTLEPADGGTLLRTETRIRATDAATRARFGLYWLAIRAGSGLIRREMLGEIARRAERSGASGGHAHATITALAFAGPEARAAAVGELGRLIAWAREVPGVRDALLVATGEAEAVLVTLYASPEAAQSASAWLRADIAAAIGPHVIGPPSRWAGEVVVPASVPFGTLRS